LFKIAFFTPLLVLLCIFDAAVTNLDFFNKSEKFAAETILSGNNLSFSSELDMRIVQKYIIKNYTKKIDTVVFGSSRSMKIDHKFFPDSNFFNNSVPEADLSDYIALYGIYKKIHNKPDTIIINVDPWDFEKDYNKPMLRSFDGEFYAAASSYVSWSEPRYSLWLLKRILTTTFSISHFQYSLKKFILTIFLKSSDKNYSTTNAEGYFPTILSDGSLTESQKIRSKNEDKVAADIIKLPTSCPASFNSRMSSEKIYLFTKFIEEVRKEKIKIEFWLAPVHPIAYNEMLNNPKCRIGIETENYIRRFAEENNLILLGSYNPSKFGLSAGDFYDEKHPKRDAVQKIFDEEKIKHPDLKSF
jgi:hypothetical protein